MVAAASLPPLPLLPSPFLTPTACCALPQIWQESADPVGKPRKGWDRKGWTEFVELPVTWSVLPVS